MVSAGDEVVLAQGKRVSAGMFDVLGVAPALGRTFRSDEEQPGAGRVIILTSRSLATKPRRGGSYSRRHEARRCHRARKPQSAQA
jgi:hypothetical protein